MVIAVAGPVSSLIFSPPVPLPSLPILLSHQLRFPKRTFPSCAQLGLTSCPTSSIKNLAEACRFTEGHPDILSIACPALAYADTLYFKSGFNVQVDVDEDETEDSLVTRFNLSVRKARILQECRRRRFFESTQEKRKRKTKEAARRYRKRRPQPRAPPVKEEAPKKKKQEEDEDDNWELPEGDIPYCKHIYKED